MSEKNDYFQCPICEKKILIGEMIMTYHASITCTETREIEICEHCAESCLYPLDVIFQIAGNQKV